MEPRSARRVSSSRVAKITQLAERRDRRRRRRQVRVLYAGQEVACHAQNPGRRITMIERKHLAGIVSATLVGVSWITRLPAGGPPATLPPAMPAELLRPLAEYESALGGRW